MSRLQVLFVHDGIFSGCHGNPAPLGESQNCYTCHNTAVGEKCNNTQTCSARQVTSRLMQARRNDVNLNDV